jgi:hypothetical protein
MAFASVLPLVMTPTTVLLDNDGTVLWSKAGTLLNDDLRDAIEVLRKQVGLPGPTS